MGDETLPGWFEAASRTIIPSRSTNSNAGTNASAEGRCMYEHLRFDASKPWSNTASLIGTVLEYWRLDVTSCILSLAKGERYGDGDKHD